MVLGRQLIVVFPLPEESQQIIFCTVSRNVRKMELV